MKYKNALTLPSNTFLIKHPRNFVLTIANVSENPCSIRLSQQNAHSIYRVILYLSTEATKPRLIFVVEPTSPRDFLQTTANEAYRFDVSSGHK